ncbi:MAG: TlpA family protein disulfide reductase [Flavobacteriaceae bacterium]|nr:TlpA family protein disulfide reductase [Flavobacteriaceae bacterium]
MKRIHLISILFIGLLSCNTQSPVYFTEQALADTFIGLAGEQKSLQTLLDERKGKTFVINVWASWCSDCIRSMPDLKALQAEFSEVEFLFLSEDRSIASWKKAIQRYALYGDHYFMPEGNDGPFAKFLNSNWIPRYMVIDPEGNIKLFKAKKVTDPKLKQALQ